MSRKDTAQELDRPHYYSQFWIDVAQGKRDLAADHIEEAGAEEAEEESFGIEPEPVAKAAAKPKTTPKAPEKARPVISSLADLANIDLLMKSSAEMEGDEVPDIESGAMDDLEPFSQSNTAPEPAIVTDFDVDEAEEEPEALLADDLEDEEGDLEYDEEEEDDWGSSRKPSKPQKPRKQPRERRGF